jgi:hypothetical protein
MTDYNIVACFACGGTYIYKDRRGELNGRFCSLRCQSAFDDGYTPPADPPDTLTGWKVLDSGIDDIGADYYASLFGRTPIAMKRTPNGFKVACAGCQREFESLGQRCCSDKCERRYREREANIALMAEVGVEPSTKRRCAAPGCATIIPKLRKGRKVSSSTRFCSPARGHKRSSARFQILTSVGRVIGIRFGLVLPRSGRADSKRTL